MTDKIREFLGKDNITAEDIIGNFTLEERLMLAAGINGFPMSELDKIPNFYKFRSSLYEKKILFLSSQEALVFIRKASEEHMIELLRDLRIFMNSADLYKFYLEFGYLDHIASCFHDDNIIINIINGLNHDDDMNYNSIVSLIENIKNPELKIKMMKKYVDKSSHTYVVASFEKDEDKIKYLHVIPHSDRLYVICNIESDEIKEKFIHIYGMNRAEIIASLKSDERKLFYFKKYFHILTGREKANIIASFKDVNIISNYINVLKSPAAIVEYLSNYSGNRESIPFCNQIATRLTKEGAIVASLVYIKDQETRNILISRLRSPRYMNSFIESFVISLEDLKMLLPRANDYIIEKIIRSDYVSNYCPEKALTFLAFLKNKQKIFNFLEHLENLPEYDDSYEYLADLCANKYSLNKNHLIKILRITDCSLLASLANENIKKIINLDEENFSKFISIFNPESFVFTVDAHNAILNALIQKKFDLKHKKIVEFGVTLNNVLRASLKSNDFSELDKLIEEMLSVVNIEEFDITRENFIDGLKKNDSSCVDLMRKMAHKYVIAKRSEYLVQELPDSKIKTSIATYEKNAYIKYYLKDTYVYHIIEGLNYSLLYTPDIFTAEEKEIIKNKELLYELIQFKKDPAGNKESAKLVGQYGKYLFSILDKALDRIVYTPAISELPIVYEMKETKDKNLVNILCSINVDQLKETLFTDSKMLNDLIEFLKKYKVLGWCDIFEEVAMASDISFNHDIIAELINNYPAIIEAIKKRCEKQNIPFNPSLIKIMDEAGVYDTYSVRYSILFGSDNFRYIRLNPEPFRGSWTKEDRIKKSVSLIGEMYKKTSIPVPGINKNYSTSTNKKLKVVVGNTTDLINLTLGERTGACMRLGSAGDSLFRFALLDPRGFHIRIHHPETGELISRLSCFRNGNTVVFNQLRHSLSPMYADSELIEIVKQVANELIEITKDSESPINNVVINGGYGFEKSGMKSVNLGKNVTSGMDVSQWFGPFETLRHGRHVYSDVDEYGIVLASSYQDGSVYPVNFSAPIPKYEPQRLNPQIYYEEQAQNMVLHYKILNAVVNGKSMDSVELVRDEKIVTCIAGDDWYISVNNMGNIEQFIMDGIDRSKARREMKIFLEAYKDKISLLSNEDINKLVS